jgi:two-component system cell cycle sensor histidine kinase/response regulator CckA
MPKNETVELLAGGIAHDFDLLLTAIVGHADNLSDYLSPADPRAAEVVAIRQAAAQANALTQQLLAFSRTQALQPTVVDLNGVLDRMRHGLQRLLGNQVALDLRQAPDLWRVRADGVQLEHILRHLAVNARDAMPAAGVLTIATANLRVGEDEARRREVEPGDYVELSVADKGIGIESRMQAHLFEPFYTTKLRVRGTGLGLAMVYGAVKQSGGGIHVESEVGRGSRFKVILPATLETAEAQHAGRGARAESDAETVLLMGDDCAVQAFINDVLRRRGYRLLVAEDLWQAMRLAEAHDAPIDLLITTGTNGAALADALCGRNPATRVLYVLASETDTPRQMAGTTGEAIDVLNKPFSPDTLARKVRAVLER